MWCSVARLLRGAEGQSIHKWRSSLVRLATGSTDQCTGRRGSIKPSRVCQLCWPPQGLLAAKAFRNVILNLKSGSTNGALVICHRASRQTVQFRLKLLHQLRCDHAVHLDANRVHQSIHATTVAMVSHSLEVAWSPEPLVHHRPYELVSRLLFPMKLSCLRKKNCLQTLNIIPC